MAKSIRCCVCNKKLKPSVAAMQCKCSANVCKQHRFPDQHNCSYNFLKENKIRLRNELPHVKCDKVLRI